VPSRWKETFGLISIEALSYDVNVFVSKNVGSKDLVSEEHIFHNKDDLLKKIQYVKFENVKFKTMKEHMVEIINYYERITNDNQKIN
ncbi:TPA: glycosyl transferase family 1, partial [Streptococcus pneumoniae]